MATVYHRDDVGAPVYAFSSGATNGAHFIAFKAILKACLVSGYGSKSPAGWELITEGDQFIVLRNGAHSGYVCLSRPTTSVAYIEVWLSDTFTGMSGNNMAGDGLKSGVAANNSAPHRIYIGSLAYASTSSTWHLVADNRSFCFVGVGHSSPAAFTDQAYTSSALYVGETSAGFFVALGGQAGSSNPLDYFDARGITLLRNPLTGLLVSGLAIAAVTPTLTGGAANGSRALTIAEVNACAVSIYGDGVFAGYLRGVAIPVEVMGYYLNTAAMNMGVAGGATMRNLNTPVNLGDGHTWFFGARYFSGGPVFMTSNKPELW
jgi:hypothetical protein